MDVIERALKPERQNLVYLQKEIAEIVQLALYRDTNLTLQGAM